MGISFATPPLLWPFGISTEVWGWGGLISPPPPSCSVPLSCPPPLSKQPHSKYLLAVSDGRRELLPLYPLQALFKERYEKMSVENQQACRLRFQKLRERLLVSIAERVQSASIHLAISPIHLDIFPSIQHPAHSTSPPSPCPPSLRFKSFQEKRGKVR